jgi:hypothetical protein
MLLMNITPPDGVSVCLQNQWSKAGLFRNIKYAEKNDLYNSSFLGCAQQPYARDARSYLSSGVSSTILVDKYTGNMQCGNFTDSLGGKHQCCCCPYHMSFVECAEKGYMFASNGICAPAGVKCPNTTVTAKFLSEPYKQVFDTKAFIYETEVQKDCKCEVEVEKRARGILEGFALFAMLVAFPLEMVVGLVIAASERQNSCFNSCNLTLVRNVSKLFSFVMFVLALIFGLTSDQPFHFVGGVAWELWVMFTLEIYQLMLFLWFAESAGDLGNPYDYVLFSKGCDPTETTGMVVSTALVLGATIAMEKWAEIALQVWTAIGGIILVFTAFEDVYFPAEGAKKPGDAPLGALSVDVTKRAVV